MPVSVLQASAAWEKANLWLEFAAGGIGRDVPDPVETGNGIRLSVLGHLFA